MKADGERRWSKCKACGSSRVNVEVVPALEAGKERVVVTCAACENRRGAYDRRRRPQGERGGR